MKLVNIARMSLLQLRAAIQNNQVSFPAQVPTFACQSRADVQWRLVELYFVRNWSCSQVGERYGATLERARQLIKNWVNRAISLGYLQEIPADAPAFAKAAMWEGQSPAAQAAIASALLSRPVGQRTGTRSGA